jgi:hypothetical protein
LAPGFFVQDVQWFFKGSLTLTKIAAKTQKNEQQKTLVKIARENA